jgi:LacI family transcriptional regulator
MNLQSVVKGIPPRMKPNRTSATLRDIAEQSGVSITTASRILNHRETGIPIREETRLRVLRVATDLGYKPNLLARGLRGSRSSLLGAIARDIADPFHTLVLRGINEAATRRGYRLFLGHVDYQPDVALAYGSMFEQSHADGIILIGDLEGDEAALEVFARQHRYVVGVSDRVARRRVPGVYADSVIGTRLALEHLWSLGHRAIICISDPRIFDERRRIEVYEEFMRAQGRAEAVRVYLTSQEPEPSLQLGLELFAGFGDAARPTAIYAASDTIAIGILQAAYQSGVKIPDDVSVIGYDDIEFTDFTVPPLTTISQRGIVMGKTAGNLLMDMIEQDRSGEEVEDVVLAPELVVRRSTAPPPGL